MESILQPPKDVQIHPQIIEVLIHSHVTCVYPPKYTKYATDGFIVLNAMQMIIAVSLRD